MEGPISASFLQLEGVSSKKEQVATLFSTYLMLSVACYRTAPPHSAGIFLGFFPCLFFRGMKQTIIGKKTFNTQFNLTIQTMRKQHIIRKKFEDYS